MPENNKVTHVIENVKTRIARAVVGSRSNCTVK